MTQQIIKRGITDKNVLLAMDQVKRHEFVPVNLQFSAYEDRPLPIGYDQTISQPYIVALMTEKAKITPEDRVLEIGTGSGYQTAVLAELAKEVYSIEIVEPLAQRAAETLKKLGYKNIFAKNGDGYKGWPGSAPFDVIIVTAAPPEIPVLIFSGVPSESAELDRLRPRTRLIEKPYSLVLLVQTLEEMLTEARQAQ